MGSGELIAGRYEIAEPIARGGMAEIHSARDRDGSPVAIKILKRSLAKDPEVRTRFEREARAAARLDSPHVVRIHDVGEHEGRPFIVMELLVGRDLSKELWKAGPLALEDAAALMADACGGIIAAHEAGIVHRDLKPQNLVVTEIAGRRGVKVVDFGISKMMDLRPEDHITRSNALFGSPLYMSPETYRSAKAADARSDVWALGVIFYEMLTGSTPFEAETPVAVGLRVTKDGYRAASEIRPELPPSVDVVIARALKKSPDERYQSVRALLAAIEVYVPRDRNDTLTIARIDGADDDRRTLERIDLAETTTFGREAPSDDGAPTRVVADVSEDATRVRAAARASATRAADAASETGRVARPVSVTAPPRAERKKRSPLVWAVPVVALLCGAAGWWLGRATENAAAPNAREGAAATTTEAKATGGTSAGAPPSSDRETALADETARSASAAAPSSAVLPDSEPQADAPSPSSAAAVASSASAAPSASASPKHVARPGRPRPGHYTPSSL